VLSLFLRLLVLGFLCGGIVVAPAHPQTGVDALAAVDRAMVAAESSLRKKEFEAAEALYREAVFEASLLLIELERLEGRRVEAERALGNASTFLIESPPALRALATVNLQMGEAGKAVDLLTAAVEMDPRDVESRRLLAKALAAVGEGGRALQRLDEAAAAGPHDPEQVYLLATEYLWLKRVDVAERLFAQVFEARPIPQTRVLVGRTYRDAGEYERARSELRAALAQDPTVRRAHYYLGMVALADPGTGPARLDEAIAQFREELKLAPEDPLANDQLGAALLDADRAAEALPALETAVRSEPRSLYAYHLGRCQNALDRPAEAANTLKHALELADAQGLGVHDREKIHYQLGLALRKVGAEPEATAQLAEARRLAGAAASRPGGAMVRASEPSPLSGLPPPLREEMKRRVDAGLAQAYFNLGVLQAHGQSAAQERFARAAAFFERAAEIDPAFPKVQSSLGVAYFNARRFDEATAPLARALEAAPDDAGIRRLLAISWLNTASWDEAAALLRDDPGRASDPSLQFAYGLALVRTSQGAEAERVLGAVPAQKVDSGELSLLLGQAYALQGKHGPALESLERALRLKDGNAEVHLALGQVHSQVGRWREATEHLEAAARLRPEDALVLDQLGRAYQELGRSDLAREQFEASRRLKARQ